MPDRPTEPESPEDQAKHLIRTNNGPTVTDEASILADEFGDPNTDGVYGAPDQDGGEAA
ncbi:hypothetical protein AB0N99_30990 [Streptomyces sp. NPDC093272]|uniref:hypothetical protein n=1 Tax=Streptomyces sp. NPDC093272 TaxID=3154981 RepID=UPI0034258AAC